MRWSVPSGAHSGWTIDSSGPPAASIASPSVPSASNDGDPQQGGIPRHVRVVPLEPGEARPVRRQPWGGDEIGALDEHLRVPAVERDGDDGVGRLGLHRVVLADGVEAAAGEVRPEVCVAPRTGRRDRHRRLGARIEPVEPAIGELGEDDDPADDDVRTAAIFVDPRSDIERRRRQVGGRAVRGGRGRGRAGRPRPAGPRPRRCRRRRSAARPAG